MRQHIPKTKGNSEPTLRVVRNPAYERPELIKLAATAWTFAYSALWNGTQFSSKEVQAAKERIIEYLQLSKQPRKALLSFCQRVVLARLYVRLTAGPNMPLPSVWLDRSNEKGFAGTKSWYDQVKTLRDSLPNYRCELKALAEASLEFSEEPTRRNFLYWKSYFMEKQTPGLLQLFQVFAINHLFTI